MKRLKELYGEIHDLSAAFALLEYDQQTGMPAGAETDVPIRWRPFPA
jgi:Zn-dependent M32 family carboxypeptidase